VILAQLPACRQGDDFRRLIDKHEVLTMEFLQRFRFRFFSLFFLVLAGAGQLPAQTWNFVKEEEGIRVYTRQEAGKSLRAYKGTADLNVPAVRVFSLIENVTATGWWDPNISNIKVLAYERNRNARLYLVFDSPWPVSDRDLYVDVTVTEDNEKGLFRITSVPPARALPAAGDLVRIRDYRQTWTITATGKNSCHIVLEGYVDPAGNIPDWVSNMLVNQSPVHAILGIRKGLDGKLATPSG
jgi:hypothetical protein